MQLTKQEFLDSINSLLADNSSQLISPQDVRTGFINVADSFYLWLDDKNISASNISTPDDRTTVLGVQALDKLGLAGRSSADNTAVGYRALYQNYDGTDITAIGSQAASCNLYGDHLVAIGKNALAGNVTGSGSVGIGNFAGQGNKNGDFCIYLGHGAGNYVGQNQDYRLYIGAHAVDWDDLCDSEAASGNVPTIFGDLENHKIAIGTNVLHNFGALQSSGDISPVTNEASNLGHGSRQWAQAWLSSGIAYPSSGSFTIGRHAPKGGGFPDQYIITNLFTMDSDGKIGIGTAEPSGAQGLITVGGSIIPNEDRLYRIGTPGLRFDGYFDNVVISGTLNAYDTNYVNLNESVYNDMTLHLGVSGTGDPTSSGFVNNALYGYLSDAQLNGAGLIIHASGNDYQRDYQWIYFEPDQSLVCLENDNNYTRSHWVSNISIKTAGGAHVQTGRILGSGNKLSMVTESGCNGVFLRTVESEASGHYIYFGSEDHVGAYSTKKNANFYAPSGGQDYFVGIHTIDSGVTLGLDFATHAGTNSPSGFSLEYVNRLAGDDTFVIKRNASSIDALTVTESGFVGVSNWDNIPVMPQTNFHVRTKGGAEARISSNGTNNSSLRIERINTSTGMAITYNPTDNMVDFVTTSGSAVRSYDQNAFMTIDPMTNYVTIGQVYKTISTNRTFDGVAPLAVYHDGVADSGTLALREQASAPSNSAGWGKIAVKPKVESGRTQTLVFVDDGGNIFDLTTGGNEDGLHHIEKSTTAIGSGALNSATAPDHTVGVGPFALENAVNPKFSTVVGAYAASSGTSITSGVIIGARNMEYSTSTPTGAILIGTYLNHNTTVANYEFAIGHGTSPVITGDLSSRDIGIQNGSFSVGSVNDSTVFSVDHAVDGGAYNTIFDIKDNVNSTDVSGILKLTFTDNSSTANTLATFNHRASGMVNSPSYVGPTGDARPFMQLEGDMKLRGALMFADGTYLDTADGRAVYAGTGLIEQDVAYGTLVHLSYNSLNRYTAVTNNPNINTAKVAVSVTSGGVPTMTHMTLSDFGLIVNSGDAQLANNCNMLFTDSNISMNTVANTGSIFIGCGAGINATGWKHSVILGTDAGKNATTPNVGLTTDTAAVFIGYRAGYDADNISNLIAIGTNAGNEARNAEGSIFIGQSAGNDIQVTNSIGIGENALRGTAGGGVGGDGNIEIVAGMLDSQRLMWQKGDQSNRLNIGNIIAGNMSTRKVSIGDAVLGPDAPLSVRKDSTIPGHSGTDAIQTWYCEDIKVAQVDCDGEFESIQYPQVIEGFTENTISCPSGYQWPTSGILLVRGEDFITTREVYITHRDPSRTIGSGVFSLAIRVNKEYRPFNPGCSGV